MYCPRCGAENDQGNRYCVNCGSELIRHSRTSERRVSPRQRLMRIIGPTRRARMLSTATVVAIAVAVAAFALLKPSKERDQDAFTTAADKTCVAAKQRIAALEARAAHERPPNAAGFARALLVAVEEWRFDQNPSDAPPSHSSDVKALDSSLLDILMRTGTLARIAEGGGSAAEVAAAARMVDVASKQVDQDVEELGLKRCSDFSFGAAALGGS